MRKNVNVRLQQPSRFILGIALAPPFIALFFIFSWFYPGYYIIIHFFTTTILYWIARVRSSKQRQRLGFYVWLKFRKMHQVVPTLPHKPFIGSTYLLQNPDQLIQLLDHYIGILGNILAVKLPIGNPSIIAVADAESFKTIMSTHNTPKGQVMMFLEKGASILIEKAENGWLGTGLLTSNGALWKSRRDMLTPAFHFQILQNYMRVFRTQVNIFINRLTELSKSGNSFDIFPLATDLTLDIIAACAFGVDLECQSGKEPSTYVRAIRRISSLVFNRIFTPSHYLPLVYRLSKAGREFAQVVSIVHELPERLILQRRAYLEKNPNFFETKEKLDFLDVLLTATDENGDGLDFTAIRNEVDTFLFEGHDTTAAALTWTIYLLAKHPEYQRKAQEEVDAVLAEYQKGVHPTYEQSKSKFPFLELILKESLRLYPPVPFIARHTDVPLKLGSYDIPAGTEIFLLIYTIQRLPQYWKNPDEFIPERWLDNQVINWTNIPFSAGHRSCIGQIFAQLEEITTLSLVLMNFDLVLDDSCIVEPETHLILRPKNGVKIWAKPRLSSVH